MKNFILLSIIFLIFQSCVSFEHLSNPNKLGIHNLNKLEGIYEINHTNYPSKYDKNYSYTWYSKNFFNEIDRNLLKDTLILDSSKYYKFELKILNDRKIKIDYIQNESIFRSRIIKAKLKKDGYLYLKNKNIGVKLIPYLFGGIDIKKTRITLDQEQNLIFDKSHHTSGAMLFIVFLDGETNTRRLQYKRIK